MLNYIAALQTEGILGYEKGKNTMHDEEVKDYKQGYQNTELRLHCHVCYVYETKLLPFCLYVYFHLNCMCCLT